VKKRLSRCSGEPAGKEVSTETEESLLFRSHHQRMTGEETADWKHLVRAAVICKVWRLVRCYTQGTRKVLQYTFNFHNLSKYSITLGFLSINMYTTEMITDKDENFMELRWKHHRMSNTKDTVSSASFNCSVSCDGAHRCHSEEQDAICYYKLKQCHPQTCIANYETWNK
jgi:hypothetical protein